MRAKRCKKYKNRLIESKQANNKEMYVVLKIYEESR